MGSQQLRTLERGVAVLIELAKAGPMTVPLLAQRLEVPVSTAYRYVASLREAGMVWDLPGARFGLGPRCVQLDLGFRRSLDEWSPCQPVMAELAGTTGETVALLVPVRFEAVCVDIVESGYALRYSLAKGSSRPMLRGAAGKAMLAHLAPEMLEELLERDGGLGGDRRSGLLEELRHVRSRGYAVGRGESDRGVWSVGVPVLDENGGLEAALSLLAPTVRSKGREAFLIQSTLEAAASLPTISPR